MRRYNTIAYYTIMVYNIVQIQNAVAARRERVRIIMIIMIIMLIIITIITTHIIITIIMIIQNAVAAGRERGERGGVATLRGAQLDDRRLRYAILQHTYMYTYIYICI